MATSDPFNSSLPLPLNVLSPDQIISVNSLSSSSTYNCKRVNDHYSCSCPAWRNQRNPINGRTCKHLRELLGDQYEQSRLEQKGLPLPAAAKPSKKKLDPTAPSMSKKMAQTLAKTSKVNGTTLGKDAAHVVASTEASKIAKEAAIASGEKKAPAVKKTVASSSASGSASGSGAGSNSASGGSTSGNGEEKIVPELLLAKKFELEGKKSPENWWISEKLDGVRAFWDGKGAIWSRLGNKFIGAPAWWLGKLPQGETLDGELFHSRDNFNNTVSIVRSHNSDKWDEIRFQVFDIPSSGKLPFEARQAKLLAMFPPVVAASTSAFKPPEGVDGSIVDVVEQIRCTGLDHLLRVLKEVEGKGGEGLMLREPKSIYVGKRSGILLKVKTFFDADAKVIGYEPGKGKYFGMTGSLLCQMESGKTFNCGSGLDDSQRSNPPAIGSIISYRFQEITKDNVPRFPTFIGERIDLTSPKDADVSVKGANKKSGEGEDGDDE